jgi:hypothetical protein
MKDAVNAIHLKGVAYQSLRFFTVGKSLAFYVLFVILYQRL